MNPKNSVLNDEFIGKLYYLEESEVYLARVRFDYKKEVLKKLKEGEFILISNFNSDENNPTYSVLKIISLFPKHYALEAVKGSGYPGFLKDVMINIEEDWNLQNSAETYIDCIAIPMGYDIVLNKNETQIQDIKKRTSKPIPGKQIFLFSPESLETFMSWGIKKKEALKLGTALDNDKISIYIDLSSMVRRHFGVFASTGSGKSNFLAQLIRQILQEYIERTGLGIKIVIFDIQGEYPALLADILYDSGLLIIGEDDAFPDLSKYYEMPHDSTIIKKCAEIFSKQFKKPGIFEKKSDLFVPIFKKILEDNRIYTIVGEPISVPQTVEAFVEEIKPSGDGKWEHRVYNQFILELQNASLSGDLTDPKFEELKQCVENLKKEPSFLDRNGNIKNYAADVIGDYERLIEIIKRDRTSGRASKFLANDLIKLILDKDSPNLIIISISSDEIITALAATIITKCLIDRKKDPNFTHDILFVFDEAHEYISTAAQEQTNSVKKARSSLLKLARQGRKFGLGLCISTQRTRYLDTTIMGQIHTLFAGFLPRKSDREPLTDAFNITEDFIREIKDFSPGEWLLTSAVATGLLRNIPVSFRMVNSEEELKNFFEQKLSLSIN